MFSVADLTKTIDRYFCLCKFELTDDRSVNILTRRAIYVPVPIIFGRRMIGFTPGITKALNTGDYGTKMFNRDMALKRKEREEANKTEEANREEAEEAKKEAAKARREAAKRETEQLYMKFMEWGSEEEDEEEECLSLLDSIFKPKTVSTVEHRIPSLPRHAINLSLKDRRRRKAQL